MDEAKLHKWWCAYAKGGKPCDCDPTILEDSHTTPPSPERSGLLSVLIGEGPLREMRSLLAKAHSLESQLLATRRRMKELLDLLGD